MKNSTAIVVSPILCFSTPGPLLRLINLQNRGGLTYPNYQFVILLKELADIATEILPYLAQENICKQLVTILHPHLIRNSLFICNTHKDKICKKKHYPTSTRRHGNFAGVELSRPEICHLVGVRENGKQSDEFIFHKIGVFNRLKISRFFQ
jgi:hypothetical protein